MTHDITDRKRAEEALRESEEKLRAVFEVLPVGISILNDKKQIVDLNPALGKILDISLEGLLSGAYRARRYIRRDGTPMPPSEFPTMRAVEEQALVHDAEIGVVKENGETVWTSVSAAPLPGMGAVAVTMDITERKRAEEALRESETRYHHVLDTMMEGCQIIDFDWRYAYVNPVVAAQGQRGQEELLNHTMMEMYPGIENTEMFAALRRCMETRTPERMENQFTFPNGSTGWFELSIQPAREGIFILSTDITERKRAEEKLKRQNQRLKALREIDTAILASDSVENIVGGALSHIRGLIDCQRAGMALIDWEANEAVIFDVRTAGETSVTKGSRVPLTLLQAMPQAMSKPLANNQPVLIHDLTELPDLPPILQILSKEGLRSVCILPLFSQGHQIGAFNMSSEIPAFFDEEKVNLGREVANQVAIAITQSNLVEALRKLNADLEARVIERTTQLQAANHELEAFSYSVSHDLRAPLRGIDGFSQALSRTHAKALGEEGKHYLARIQENTRRMGQLIDDLLSLARISRREMKREDVDLSRMAREIADELRAQEPGRRVEFEIQEQAEARGDAGLIKIVLQNLLGNAFKFTSTREQAKIQFGLLPSPRSPLPMGEGAGGEGENIYFVRDNGVGFDMAYADKLFGAFQRLHAMNEFPGTGIGLATVQRIIHRHGGRIWAEAEAGKGAAFYFTLGGNS